jgi:MFS family permease
MTGTGSLWRNRDFLKLWTGESVSLVGSQVTELALPLTAVIALGAGPAEMGILGAARFLPYLFLTLPAGLLADRVRRRPILIWANLGRALLIGLVPGLAAFDALRMEQLYLIGAAVGSLTVIFDVTYWSYLPSVVEREQLIEGNSRLMATSAIASIGGPGLGGLLVQLLTAPVALLVDAASFVVSSVSLALIRRAEPAPPRPAGRSVGRDLRDGLATVAGNPILRSLAATAGLYNLFNAWIDALFVLFAVDRLGLTPGTIGLVLAAGAAGALAGSLAAAPLARRIGIGPAVVWSVVFECVAMLPIALAGGPALLVLAVLVAAFFVNGAGVSLSSVHAITLRQTLTPDELLGRMTASYRFIGYGGIPVGAFLGGLVGEVVGVRGAIGVGAIGMLSAALVVIASPLPRLRAVTS